MCYHIGIGRYFAGSLKPTTPISVAFDKIQLGNIAWQPLAATPSPHLFFLTLNTTGPQVRSAREFALNWLQHRKWWSTIQSQSNNILLFLSFLQGYHLISATIVSTHLWLKTLFPRSRWQPGHHANKRIYQPEIAVGLHVYSFKYYHFEAIINFLSKELVTVWSIDLLGIDLSALFKSKWRDVGNEECLLEEIQDLLLEDLLD